MNDFPWICPACRTRVPEGAAACARCGCPEDATADVIEQHQRSQASQTGSPGRIHPKCPKCPGEMTMRGEFRGSAGGISAMFEVSNASFRTLSCFRCGFTEFYRSDVSTGEQLADLLIG